MQLEKLRRVEALGLPARKRRFGLHRTYYRRNEETIRAFVLNLGLDI